MLKSLQIFVPSSHRANSLLLFDNIPESVRERCTVVVPADQLLEYTPVCRNIGVALMAAPEGVQYIAQQRQWCTEICDTPHMAMFDDDVTFFKRTNGKLVKADLLDIEALCVEALATIKEGVPLVGISGRFMNNAVTADYAENTRMCRVWFLDLAIYKKCEINMAPYPKFVMEDFHVILRFLENGHKNRVFYKWVQDHKGSNTAGGCSTFRTAEVNRAAALWLEKHHPGVVTAVEKISKTGWDGMEKLPDGTTKRTDVKIQWKKAYKRPRVSATTLPFFKI